MHLSISRARRLHRGKDSSLLPGSTSSRLQRVHLSTSRALRQHRDIDSSQRLSSTSSSRQKRTNRTSASRITAKPRSQTGAKGRDATRMKIVVKGTTRMKTAVVVATSNKAGVKAEG